MRGVSLGMSGGKSRPAVLGTSTLIMLASDGAGLIPPGGTLRDLCTPDEWVKSVLNAPMSPHHMAM